MTKKIELLLIGCGAMGGALLKGWTENLKGFEFTVVDPKASKVKSVSAYKNLKALPAKYQPDIIMLAVKPQDLLEVLPWCKDRLTPKTVVMTIAAAKRLDFYADHLNYTQPIIRCLPNFPAMVQQSITLLTANVHATKDQCKLAAQLMEAVGTNYWVEEHQLDSLVPIVSSGPAYMFLWAEYLVSCIERKGINKEVAKKMAMDLILGSGLTLQQSAIDPLELRRQVASPKGVTEAALAVFMPALQHLLNNALDAAMKRSDEIAAEGAVKHEFPIVSAFE
jgi:pyrroline-5-carboxylate reductase